MAQKTNSFERFWKELKRRKVFRVTATYAATAYIIIEVTNNLMGPFRLPEWIPTLVALLLAIGLPVVIILSWIFDFTAQGIKKTESLEELTEKEIINKPQKRRFKVSDVVIAVLLVAVVVLAWPRIFKRDTLERLRSSNERIAVAVMPFQNMTNDTTWNVWQKGIQDMLVTDLSNSPDELKVRQTLQINTLIQSQGLTNYASMTPSLAGTISKKLDANVFIYGSIKQAGTKMRVNAELIDTKTKETLKSFEIEDTAKEEKVFLIIDSLKTQVKNFLVISKLKKGTSLNLQRYGNTYSPEAYRLFLNGDEAVWNGDPATALKLYKEAIAIDSNFVAAKLFMVAQYMFLGLYSDAKEWCLKIYKEKDHIPMMYRNNINWLHSRLFETPLESIKYLQQELQSYGDQAVVYGIIGSEYLNLHQYDKAIPEYEKVLKLNKEWDENPVYGSYTFLGFAYHKTGQYKKEKKLYREAVNYFPDNPNVIFRQAVLELTEGDTITANKYIEKYISIMKENARAESVIMVNLGNIYNQAGILDKAEKYYRKALSLEPENPVRMNTLAWFLIDNDRNIKEGMQHVGKALEFNPANFEFLDTKGWGLFKKGNYIEALKILQKADSLKPIYNHTIYLLLGAAKKSVANQKNN
jgi:tetratricopeptide (TPR) repeat protein